MKTYPTQAAALAAEATERGGNVLIRFAHEGIRTYQWVTSLDVEEMLSYGDDDFDVVLDYGTQALL